MTLDELLLYLRLGGFTLALLIACSLLALGVAVERLLALWNVSEATRELAGTLNTHLLKRDLAAARSAAERSEALTADVFLTGLDRAARPDQLEAAVQRERIQVSLKMRRNLWMLGTIGATAPFIGLFGTVAGIMTSFKDLGLDVGAGGTGGSAAVMTGISEALIVTAVGILVAVEAVVLYNYFQSRLSRIAIELRLASEEFVEQLRDLSRPPEPESPAIIDATPTAAPTP